MLDRPKIKQRAIITIDNDAPDYISAADFQKAVAELCDDLSSKYLRAYYDVRDRRDPKDKDPKPVTVNRRTQRVAAGSLKDDL